MLRSTLLAALAEFAGGYIGRSSRRSRGAGVEAISMFVHNFTTGQVYFETCTPTDDKRPASLVKANISRL